MTKLISTKKKELTAVPMYNYMFLTVNKTSVRESGIIMPDNMAILDEQIVLKVGSAVSTIKPGDTVKIDPRHYMVRKMGDKFTQDNNGIKEDIMREAKYVIYPVEEIDGIEVMVIPDNHIRWYWHPQG